MISITVTVDTDEEPEYSAAKLLAATIQSLVRPEVPVEVVCDVR